MGDITDSMLGSFNYWFSLPEPEKDEDDNIWSDFHVFNGEWVEVQNRMDWYESPHVPSIYEDHIYVFKQNMGMGRPEETFYEQNVDSGKFVSTIEAKEKLPSGNGEHRITSNIKTKSPPSGENNFCMVEYHVETHIRYDLPKSITFLPRILARPLNRFFRWAFIKFVGEEMLERDGEYALEKTTEYFQYMRKYHGEEPIQTKSRQAEFKPMPEEGLFFQ